MRHSNPVNALSFLLICLSFICINGYAQMHTVAPFTDIFTDNSSADGIQGQSFILMHNRKGIRIEYGINRRRLEMWVSPLAGLSNVYIDRNFSNRDDHTKLFDQITFPQLHASLFERCDYDPFHSIVYYKNGQVMHILSVYDKPSVIIWFEKPEWVDIKTDKQDKIIKLDSMQLVSNHPDRGKVLQFVAALGNGSGKMVHQKFIDPFRSHYTRAYLGPNQILVFSGDDISIKVQQIASVLSFQDIQTTLLQNQNAIREAVRDGSIILKNHPELQKIIDLNKKVLLSMQDESGAIRAALRYIYYLIWHRDGAMVNAYNAYSGWVWPLKDWVNFELSNPTVMEKNGLKERFFGQLVGGKITKLEEDGPFYGIWSAFTYWNSTGDDTFLAANYLRVLDDNIAWWERNFYDSKKELFYRYHYCESPYYNSFGDGWDDAMGTQTQKNISKYKSDTIVRAYDLYINYIAYASYLMMSAMHTDSLSGLYLKKAKNLEIVLKRNFSANEPTYGYYVNTQNRIIESEPFGMDATDYVWGLTVPPFAPIYHNQRTLKQWIRTHQTQKPRGLFYPEWFSTLASMDPEIHGESALLEGIKYVIPQCVKPGTCLPMPYTICEIIDVEDCNVYHDVRPQAFSISALIASVSNLAVKKYPFGIALRGNSLIQKIESYQYKKSKLHIRYTGTGSFIKSITLNGKSLASTYQIPENLLKEGKNEAIVTLQETPNTKTTLIGSTLQLLDQKNNRFEIGAYGKNVLFFKNLKKPIVIKNQNNEQVPTTIQKDGDITYVEFEGVGNFIAFIQ